MATQPIPRQTAANNALISSLPYEQLTQRQKDYADMYGVSLQTPKAIQPQLAPYYSDGTAVQGGGVVQGGQVVSQPTTGTTGPTTDAPPDPYAEFLKQQAAESKLAGQRDALALIRRALSDYGLPDSLADWAWSEIQAGKSNNEVLLDLRQRPEFKAEFGGVMDARQKAGFAPLSPADIVTYRNEAKQLMRAAGMPVGFYDTNAEIDRRLADNVSLKELGDRITDWSQFALNAPVEDRQQADALGFSHGDLTAMLMNPDVAEPILHKQLAAAALSGSGVRSGFGALTADQALRLTEQGVSGQQADQGFASLVHQQELFNPLDTGETAIGRQEQIDAGLGGNASAQQRIQDRARRRTQAFNGGGSYAASNSGLTGLGGSGS